MKYTKEQEWYSGQEMSPNSEVAWSGVCNIINYRNGTVLRLTCVRVPLPRRNKFAAVPTSALSVSV